MYLILYHLTLYTYIPIYINLFIYQWFPGHGPDRGRAGSGQREEGRGQEAAELLLLLLVYGPDRGRARSGQAEEGRGQEAAQLFLLLLVYGI